MIDKMTSIDAKDSSDDSLRFVDKIIANLSERTKDRNQIKTIER